MDKDLGVKIGTKEEVLWTKVMNEAKIYIEQSENNLIIQNELLKIAESKIKEEQDKMKVK